MALIVRLSNGLLISIIFTLDSSYGSYEQLIERLFTLAGYNLVLKSWDACLTTCGSNPIKVILVLVTALFSLNNAANFKALMTDSNDSCLFNIADVLLIYTKVKYF